jgi:hypothetical protein
MLLQHDNATPHTSARTSAAMQSIISEVVPHLSYSPDLALSDFWLFEALNKHVKGINFTCDEVEAAMRKRFREQPVGFYGDRFEKLVHHWWLCIEREGDYMEKCGIETKNTF